MKTDINTYKFDEINQSDSFSFEGKDLIVTLDDKNEIKDKLMLLYVFRLPKFQNHGFKVGMVTCGIDETFWSAIKKRISKETHELGLNAEEYEKYGKDREVVFWGVSVNDLDGEFKDHRIHNELKKNDSGYVVEKDQEWFRNIPLEKIKETFVKYRDSNCSQEVEYIPRKEQEDAINKLVKYFNKNDNKGRFLLNCKMRFGKCYTVYKYCEEKDFDKILILTFVPAVQESWKDDLKHIKKRYKYITDNDLRKENFQPEDNPVSPYVVFLSLQNLLGKSHKKNEIKEKIKKLKNIHFDLLVLDEYHFGAWNDRTQSRIKKKEIPEDIEDQSYLKELNGFDPIKDFEIQTKETICLSGTPFKALEKCEFEEEAIYSYTYFDEQKNKYPYYEDCDAKSFKRNTPVKPYDVFPDLNIYGYKMSNLFGGLDEQFYESMQISGRETEYFSLNTFFKTYKDGDKNYPNDEFVYEEQVKEWLTYLHKGKPDDDSIFPYQRPHREKNKHSLWLLPTINSCLAMEKLLKNDEFFSRYTIANLSKPEVGTGEKALNYLKGKINESRDEDNYGSIAITVNKLTLGVTVKAWSAILILKDLASPEQYFQSIFRVQSPYVEQASDGSELILKSEANVYDFIIDRAAALLLDFAHESERFNNITALETTQLILKFLPIYMDGKMEESIDEDVLYSLMNLDNTDYQALSRSLKKVNNVMNFSQDTIANMANDKRIQEIFGSSFAYTKFKTINGDKKHKVLDPDTNQTVSEFKKGREIGMKYGKDNFQKFVFVGDDDVKAELDETLEELYNENCPDDYDTTQKTHFMNGLRDGLVKGINLPIKERRCGELDGIKFAKDLNDENGGSLVYSDTTKRYIVDRIHKYLNVDENIPEMYRGIFFNSIYKSSFKSAAIGSLKQKIEEGEKSVEDYQNYLLHILAKLFQFLYISVYRETSFEEIFNNADAEMFKAAVGITKDDFEYLNTYHIYNEQFLDSCVHQFFVNETLGKNLTEKQKEDDNYRNSFNWFGFGVEN